MSTSHVDHSDIVRFADERVNLKREDAKVPREQANRLRSRLEAYLQKHPDFALRKILLSGSLAKGTALKSLSDIDLAVYISMVDAPPSTTELIPWLAARLRQAFPNFKPEQVQENPFTVTVLFSGTGLKMDVVPVLYENDPDWKGHLMAKDTGDKVLTSIPMHIEFIRRRKNSSDVHYAQIVRLLKFWVQNQKQQNSDFRFKSFMIELLVAHLVDNNRLELSNYPEALAQAFTYIGQDAFQSPIVFSDHYNPGLCVNCDDAIQVWDPVNHENNVGSRYSEADRELIVEAAFETGEAIDTALRAPTKSDTLRHWRRVFGPSFDA